jgi:hypothetical protein
MVQSETSVLMIMTQVFNFASGLNVLFFTYTYQVIPLHSLQVFFYTVEFISMFTE